MTAIALLMASPHTIPGQVSDARPPVIDNPRVDTTSSKWRVGPRPVFRIGSTVDSLSQFVEVGDAARLGDGGIVVSDVGASTVRRFDADGRGGRYLGRAGDGPGEFRKPSQVRVGPGDSIYVFDERAQRLTVFSGDGRLLSDVRVRGGSALAAAVERLSDGAWVARTADRVTEGPIGSMTRDTVVYARISADLQWGVPIVRLPGIVTSVTHVQGRRGFRPAPFTPRPAHGVSGRCLYVTGGDRGEILVFDSRGEAVRTIRTPLEPRRPSEADWESWLAVFLARVPDDREAEFRAVMADLPRMSRLPALSDVVVDALGFIWAQVYAPPFGDSSRWIVHTPAGFAVGSVVTPEPMKVFEIGTDYVLGRRIGDMGVEEVVAYPLDRNGSPRPPSDPVCGGGNG